jgi:hypothetical protein
LRLIDVRVLAGACLGVKTACCGHFVLLSSNATK